MDMRKNERTSKERDLPIVRFRNQPKTNIQVRLQGIESFLRVPLC